MTVRTDEFRALHRPGDPLLLPNAWDHASAAALVAQGFPAIGTTSLGIAAAAGLPDAAGATRQVTLDVTRSISRLPTLLTVDIEGGVSERPADVADLAAELAGIGVVGVNIEDGQSDGSLAEVALLCAKVAAIKDRVPDLFVNARTDAFWLGSGDRAPLPEALRRVEAYAAAGADGVFVPGTIDDGAIRTLVGAVDVPVNILFTPGQTYRQLADLGVRRVSCGSLLFRVALQSAVRAAVAIRDGAAATQLDAPTYAEVQSLARVGEPA
jgi:2-methylisocitrate lyase-like PEP mutase family enzyme